MHFPRQLWLALRSLLRSPLFTVVAVLTLALGLGATTAVFTVVHGVLLKALPLAEPDRLVSIYHVAPGLGPEQLPQAPALFLTYRDESRTLSASGLWDSNRATVTGLEEPAEVETLALTDGVLEMIGATPILGRTFNAQDVDVSGAQTILLTHSYWRQQFGGDPMVLGKTLNVDGSPREIIGVLGPRFAFLDLEPVLIEPFRLDRSRIFFGQFSFQGIGRLAPDTTRAQATEELATLIPRAMDRFPMPPGFSRQMIVEAQLAPLLRPLQDEVVGESGRSLWFVLAAVALVLLIACANVANLILVRTERRHQEWAVRAALGANRGQLAGHLMAESLILGLAGGLLGLGLSYGGVRGLIALAPAGFPRLDALRMEPVVLAAHGTLALLAAVFCAALPLLRLGRGQLAEGMIEGGRGSTAGRRRGRSRALLVTSQVALAVILLVGSGLMVRSFQALRNVPLGLTDPGQLLTFRLSIPEAEMPQPEGAMLQHQAILEELRQLPGVTAAALSSGVPMGPGRSFDPIFFEDFPTAGEQIPPMRRFFWVSQGYTETLGTRLLAGRTLNRGEIERGAQVALISESLAREVWQDPAVAVGRRIRNRPNGPWKEVVGVVADVRDSGPGEDASTAVYWPQAIHDLWQEGELFTPRSMSYLVRSTRVGTPGLLSEVRHAVHAVNPNLPVADVRTVEQYLHRSTARTSFTLVLLLTAAGVALFLSGIGLYGVTSYAVAQRTKELGIRLALGAAPREVGRLILGQGFVLAALGILTGLLAAGALTRLITALLFGIQPLDPLTYGAAALSVGLLTLLASWLPARRATRLNPVETLRSS